MTDTKADEGPRARAPDHAADEVAPGTLYWITGLAGAGKTTLARGLAARLRARGRAVVRLDGDALRAALFPEAGYAAEERLALACRYAALCALLVAQGQDVVCATVSLVPEAWSEHLRAVARTREVLVRAPRALLERRRPDLYGEGAGARGPVVGRELAAREPERPDVVLEDDGRRAPAALADECLARLDALERGAPARRPVVAPGTKAETLERLAPLVRGARVLPQERFTLAQWRDDPEAILARLAARGWLALPLIVRSSALVEDDPRASLAGRFRSALDRLGAAAVREGIDEVARSLGGERPDDQVFVQPCLRGVRASGVLLTRDPANGSRYAIVGLERSGATDGVTGGVTGQETWYRHASAVEPAPAELAGVLALGRELEALLAPDEDAALDVEFAVAADGALHLLQARALAVAAPALGPAAEARALERVRARVEALARPHPYLLGARAVFGAMPDWNPAEVIGVRPAPLAFSLYRELVTDGIWAYQRSNYGYRNLRSFPLVVSLGGLPYVDVRVSFNSFVPADLEPALGARLVEHYLERLLASPRDHDRVEFAIVHSCTALDTDRRLEALGAHGFGPQERERLAASLRALTNAITRPGDGLFLRDVAKIRELERRQEAFARAARGLEPLARVYWQLEDCKRYGTLPFAGIARAAFVAVQMLDSLVATGVLSREEREAFLRSLASVRAAMQTDLARLPRAAFLRRYGHLRPGTYDVTSPRYDRAPEAYFDFEAPPADAPPGAAPALSRAQAAALDRLLERQGLALDHAALLAFVRAAIEAREEAKFVFTRSLSDALEELAAWAESLGVAREDLAFADAGLVRRLVGGSEDARERLLASVAEGRAAFAETRQITLPPLVRSPEDVRAFCLPPCEPSFVTLKSAAGPVVAGDARASALRGAIVLLASADPGHDWIFTHGVAGLVTAYGGYNSHMAIRAGELGVPAVIGAGEALFRRWGAARRLRIDCLGRRVEVLA